MAQASILSHRHAKAGDMIYNMRSSRGGPAGGPLSPTLSRIVPSHCEHDYGSLLRIGEVKARRCADGVFCQPLLCPSCAAIAATAAHSRPTKLEKGKCEGGRIAAAKLAPWADYEVGAQDNQFTARQLTKHDAKYRPPAYLKGDGKYADSVATGNFSRRPTLRGVDHAAEVAKENGSPAKLIEKHQHLGARRSLANR